MRHALVTCLMACRWLLVERTVLVLTTLLCLGIASTLWYMSRLQHDLIVSVALQDAALYAQTLTAFRTLYTSEVVTTARQHGLDVTHDYHGKPGAIPLPVTLSLRLAQALNTQGASVNTRLYSPYPFPWRREDSGLPDAFAQDAWAALQQAPDIPFYRFAPFGGRPSLRYATADRMRPSCINCHNTHADSPKTDWQVGDVRGVLEVDLPLDAAWLQTTTQLKGLVGWLIILAGLGVSGLAVVIGRLRRGAEELSQRAKTLEHEVAERLRIEGALRESEARYRHVINAAADAIISIDEHGTIREFNDAAERLFGYAKADMLHQPLTPIIPERLRDQHWAGLQRYLATGQRQLASWEHIELPGRSRDGREFPMEVSFSLLEVENQKFLTGVLRDITVRKQAQEELHQAKADAEEANRAKSDFLARMSHELRTPLNTIIGYSEMLQEEADELDYKGLKPDLEKIQHAGRHLLNLINDILDLSKIEAGKMVLFLETFEVATLLEEVVVSITTLVAKNANRLDVHDFSGLGQIRADQTKVRQILFNLLSNACKFTNGGTIAVGAKRETRDGVEWMTFWVRDSGIGMAKTQLASLFQEYTQADLTTSHRYGGSGLGLAISQRFCHLMGGDIEVESAVGQGSLFTVHLPVEVTDARPITFTSEAPHDPPPGSVRYR